MRSIYIENFDTDEEAARAYDVVAIRMKGLKAISNFEMRNYDVNGILACEKLPIGKGASKVLKKTLVDNFLLAKRNNGKAPVACLESENPSSCQPNSQQQFTTLATAPSDQISSPYFQRNSINNANQVFHQIGGGETSGGNLSHSSNLVFPYIGVWGEHSLIMMETNELITSSETLASWNQPIQSSNDHSQIPHSYEHASQLPQPQISNFPFIGYENPNFLTNLDFLHESLSARSGLERNGIYMDHDNLNGEFTGENGVLNGNSTVTNTGDTSNIGISWGVIQQVEELDQMFQTLQQNQMFNQFHQYAGNDINGALLQDQNPDPSHSCEIQNLESQKNPNNFLYGCLTGVDQMNVGTINVNFSSCVRGLADNSCFPEEILMVMETTEKMNPNAESNNGGFRIHETPILMERNSAPQSLVEKGDQLSTEDFGQHMGDFGIDSLELDGSTFLEDLISSF